MEFIRGARGREPLHHRLDVADDALGALVAHAPEDRGFGRDRLPPPPARPGPRDRPHPPRTRAETGVTAATGSAERMMKSPMVAFQKPITDQGSVMANSTTRTKSSAVKTPAVSAYESSQISPIIEASTMTVKNARRRVRGAACAGTA